MSISVPKPIIPDTVIRFQGQPAPRILPAAADTVAVPLVHDWGPVAADAAGVSTVEGGLQEVTSFDDWVNVFGDSDTPGRTAVAGAFAGPGTPGAVGAGAVVVARMAGSSVAAASVALKDNSGGGGQNALTVAGRYKGSRGDRISVTIDSDPSNVLNDRFRVRLDGSVRETYSYSQADVSGLTAEINAVSSLIRVTDVETVNTRLAAGTFPLTGGDDGSTVLAADHLAALAQLQNQSFKFAILAPYDLTDAAIQASYVSWAQGQAAASRPTRIVLGGEAGELYAAAQTSAAAANDEHVVRVGVGTWHDDLLDKDLSTSQLAPRIAGILAAKGEQHSLTATKVGGLHAVGATAPSDQDATAAVNNGVVVFVPADSPDADVKIAKGVTTYTTQTDPSKPFDVFSDARLVGIMDGFVRGMRQWGNDKVVGSLPVNDDTRNLVYGKARALENDLLVQGLILPGDNVNIPIPWVNVIDTDTDTANRDQIPFEFGWQFGRTANAITGQGTVL